MIPLGLIGTYFIGLLCFWLADGWFKFTADLSYGDDRAFFIGFWPVTMWVVIFKSLRQKVEEARETHDKRVAERVRVRVAAEKELANTMRTLEEELEVENSSKKVSR